ncbi:MAG: hypothetical protein CVU24_03320 [Betaproteobacteria bacterium HGW-Betaproteobacteria-18]|nr:MAG: hypothetical protein CVU24_03320 [Betaproteobacteria bacterium HGW-Betaproteobacteria-18]
MVADYGCHVRLLVSEADENEMISGCRHPLRPRLTKAKNIGSIQNHESITFVRSLPYSNMDFTMTTQSSVSVREHNMKLKLIGVLQSQVEELNTKLTSEMEKRKKIEAKLKVVRSEHRKKISALNKSNSLLLANELAKAKAITDAKEEALLGIQDGMLRANEQRGLSRNGNVKIKGNLENLNDIARSKNIHVIPGGRAGAI